MYKILVSANNLPQKIFFSEIVAAHLFEHRHHFRSVLQILTITDKVDWAALR